MLKRFRNLIILDEKKDELFSNLEDAMEAKDLHKIEAALKALETAIPKSRQSLEEQSKVDGAKELIERILVKDKLKSIVL